MKKQESARKFYERGNSNDIWRTTVISAEEAASIVELQIVEKEINEQSKRNSREAHFTDLNRLTLITLREKGYKLSDNSYDFNRTVVKNTVRW